jgi:arylsulfatase A-like enzyme
VNVLIVTVDSLRADRVNGETMPATRSFADNALEFTDCVSNGSSTPASFPSILASRYFASIEGLGLPTDGNVTTLAERLQREGYQTGGFTDNHFASGSYHFDRGFDLMHDASGSMESGGIKQFVQSTLDKGGTLFRTIERVYTYLSGSISTLRSDHSEYERAASLNDRALSFIDTNQHDDWFVWLHYMDPHHPYEAPESYQREFLTDTADLSECRMLSRKGTHHPEKMNENEWDRLESLYNAECRYVDDQFAILLDELENRGLRDETAVVFTADHGEVFGEHGKGGHPGEFWEGVIRVPLILDIDERQDAVSGQVRLLDLAPTIVDTLGLDLVTEWTGRSLLPIVDGGDPVELSFGDVGRNIDYKKGYVRRADGWKLLDHREDGEFLFNIHQTPDERPADEQGTEQPEILAELRSELSNHQERTTQLRKSSHGIGEDEQIVEEHLEDLGYL